MTTSYPCGICHKPVAKTHRAIKCDICNLWCHVKCRFVSNELYQELISSENEPWNCTKCTKENLPFMEILDEGLKLTLQGKNIDDTNLPEPVDDINIFKEIEGIVIENEANTTKNESIYYTLSEFNKIKTNEDSLAVFHLNPASLRLHFDELHTLLSNCEINVDFLGITETGFQSQQALYQLQGYNNCILLIITINADKYNFKSRTDIQLYHSNNLESINSHPSAQTTGLSNNIEVVAENIFRLFAFSLANHVLVHILLYVST